MASNPEGGLDHQPLLHRSGGMQTRHERAAEIEPILKGPQAVFLEYQQILILLKAVCIKEILIEGKTLFLREW